MEIQPVPWWNRRSRMERRLIWLIGGLLFVSVGLALCMVSLVYKPELFDHSSEKQEALVVSPTIFDLDPR